MYKKEAWERFKKTIKDLERHSELYDDLEFTVTEDPETEDQKFYNNITDNIDEIYNKFLEDSREIAQNIGCYDISKDNLELDVYNVGIMKSDIDAAKEFDEEVSKELGQGLVYPKSEMIEPLEDEDKIKEFLYN